MSTRDWVLFVSTFFIAVLCGMYLYYTTFVPAYLTNPVVTDISAQLAPDWEMGVRVYGGCERTSSCPAFSLNSKGQYRYQPVPNAPIQNGRVPSELRAGFDEAFSERALRQLAQPVVAANCVSFADGLDYRIQVTTPTARYDLNTCGTALQGDGEVVALVRQTLSYLDNAELYSNDGAATRGGLSGYLEARLDAAFDYDEQ